MTYKDPNNIVELRDGAYWRTIENKVDALAAAALQAAKAEAISPDDPTISPWGPYTTRDFSRLVIPKSDWFVRLQSFVLPSVDACDRAYQELTAGNGPRQDLYKKFTREGIIADKLEDWDGDPGSASFKFKYNHLPATHDAIRIQAEAITSLTLIIQSHGAIINYAREQALNIVNATIAQLGGTAEARQQQALQGLKSLATDVPDLVVNALTEGPWSAVAGVITRLSGTAIGIALTGSKPWDIIDSMMENLDTLERDVRQKSVLVREALDALNEALNVKEILPPDVNIPD
ncbi:hypothetical protein [Flindersiella endophytica]